METKMKSKWLGTVIALFLIQTPDASGAVRYVDVNNATPAPPYDSWSNAAIAIQDAVDIADPGDVVMVTNGVYETGGRTAYGALTNRVTVDKPLTVQSVNGPEFTVIKGYQMPGTIRGTDAVRCVYLTNGSALVGFTLTNGATRSNPAPPVDRDGGGVFCETNGVSPLISNCIITGNSAENGGGVHGGTLDRCLLTRNTAGDFGGGAHRSTLRNCILSRNLAEGAGTFHGGGGAAYSELQNCSVVFNTAAHSQIPVSQSGGGIYQSGAVNCIIYYNTSPSYPNFDPFSSVLASCTIHPLFPPQPGTGNFTNAPLFADLATDDFHLTPASPCINSGVVPGSADPADFEGNPRVVGGAVDSGAYEFQSPTATVSYAWLQQFGFPLDGSSDFVDADGDGMNNWQEWRADTNPTNELSNLRILNVTNSVTGPKISWSTGLSTWPRYYYLERATDLAAQPAFSVVATNIPDFKASGYVDTNAVGSGPFFYRVGIHY